MFNQDPFLKKEAGCIMWIKFMDEVFLSSYKWAKNIWTSFLSEIEEQTKVSYS